MHFIKLYKLFYFEPFGTISDHVFFNFLFENLEFFTTNINDELVIFLEYLRKRQGFCAILFFDKYTYFGSF